MATRVPYDEFGMFHENAAEYGIPYSAPPAVVRREVTTDDGRKISSLVWGTSEAEVVFLHGGAQNAHTWDTVLLALDRPAVAVDLPGHGHSDGPRSGYLDVADSANDVAAVIEALAPSAKAVVGMSLGGLTAIALADSHPELVGALVLVDITPGVNADKSQAITAFVNGPESFPDFDSLLARTIEHNPTRSVSSLRRGILHNAEQREDGSWVWRYARHRNLEPTASDGPFRDFASRWEALSRLNVPLMLVRGMRPQSVVDDSDEAELLRRVPTARVEHVEEAGHSVQGDAPVELARLIDDFIGSM
ncbi:MAG TPA: alpha/beta hydrolase [Acidimicrobiales bacterium]|nr:alpha/beta hydrolase [Acidimicrobiales bacterium]